MKKALGLILILLGASACPIRPSYPPLPPSAGAPNPVPSVNPRYYQAFHQKSWKDSELSILRKLIISYPGQVTVEKSDQVKEILLNLEYHVSAVDPEKLIASYEALLDQSEQVSGSITEINIPKAPVGITLVSLSLTVPDFKDLQLDLKTDSLARQATAQTQLGDLVISTFSSGS